MLIPPPPEVSYTRRWDVLLDLLDEESGREPPEPYEYPETDDESECWPMPELPADAVLPGYSPLDTLCGQIVLVDATWHFTEAHTPAVPNVRAAVAWLPELVLMNNRIRMPREVLVLPTTTIGEDSLPVATTAEAVYDVGVEAMREYDDLLCRSALAGVNIPQGYDGAVSTAATEVSTGAFACAETGRVEDLSFFEALARQEARHRSVIRRSYAWFIARPAGDILSHVPGPPRLDLVQSALDDLAVPRTGWDVASAPLRSLALQEEALSASELDGDAHRIDENWYARGMFTGHTAVRTRPKGEPR